MMGEIHLIIEPEIKHTAVVYKPNYHQGMTAKIF
jgi:hypothetical protein